MNADSTEDGRADATRATPEMGNAASRRRASSRPRFLRGRRGAAELITDAETAPGDNRRRREITYSVLQFLRIPALLAAFYLMYTHHAWVLAAIVCAVTIPLPWIAVVIANETREKKDKRERNVYKPAMVREARAQAQRAQMDTHSLGTSSASPARGQLNSAPPTIDHRDDPPHEGPPHEGPPRGSTTSHGDA